jgi:DNA-directed RNA polymerase subunit K/omega
MGVGAFQFVVLSSLRAVQLTRGCRPRIDGVHKHTVMAQLEVSQGKVIQEPALALPDVIAGAAIGLVG